VTNPLAEVPAQLPSTASRPCNHYQDALFRAAQTDGAGDADDFDDELERYLDTPVVKLTDRSQVFDVLWWWHDNVERYPRLSRMARDYHAIPRESHSILLPAGSDSL